MEIARLTPLAYDVFVSFYGKDTRKSFTSHLLAALEQRGFHTFRDDDKLKRGEHIGNELEKAIEQSRVSLVVLSQNYAKSRWCLNELVKIMDCKEKFGQTVFPIFHGVEPSDVRAQKGYFGEAFAKHAKHGLVEKWREALTNVADLSGWDLQKVANGDEACLVQKVVEEVQEKLNILLHVAPYEIGLESRLQELEEKLKMEADDVRIVAICGMGGIGKTTIAKKLYNAIRHKFEGSAFVANIRETSKQPNGMVILQEQLLSEILGSGTHGMRNFHHGIEVIRQRAFCRKVLLILDDVDNDEQLNALAINRDFFQYFGSRIVITTRVRDLPGVDEVYEVEELNKDESFKLFSWHCFNKDHPTDDHLTLSNQVVDYAGGLPLAIEVLGALFRGKSMGDCKTQIAHLRLVPRDNVQGKLKISYDSLNKEMRELFLDVTCFFVGTNEYLGVKMLKACNSFAEAGIRVLTDRCLIKYNAGKIVMHDLIRDMGRVIVQEESRFPGHRSRLWRHEDALKVLGDGTGTEAVEGLLINFDELNEVQVNPKAFEKMNKLWLLHLNNVHLKERYDSYDHISRELKWLCWKGFPLSCLPSNLHMENLVTLDLRRSRLKKAWNGTKKMFQLKFLYLSHCYQLVETPNFSGLHNLKELLLNDCKSLEKVDESILCLKELVVLDMKNCTKIRKFPFDILKLKSLESVDLSGCSVVKYQSSFSSWIFRTKGAESIHSSLSHVLRSSCLKNLSMRDCNLPCLPNEVGNLILLETLDLSGNNLGTLPDSICDLTGLRELYLSRCNLLNLPGQIGRLISLSTLYLDANDLCTLPDSICDLTGLRELYLSRCNLLNLPGQIGRLISLSTLYLDANDLCTLPDSICDLTGLRELYLSRCNLLNLPGQIGRLISLSTLYLDANDLCTLPDSICDLHHLGSLKLSSCKLSRLPDRIGMLRGLHTLDLQGNHDLLSLPHSCRDLSKLRSLFITKCRRLQSFPQLPENLYRLFASGCTSLESIGMPAKFHDRYIYLHGCNMLFKSNFANNLMERIRQSLLVSSQHLASPGFKILLPGDEVPNWFKYQSMGSRLSVEVPRKIRDWFLCIVFTLVLPDGFFRGIYGYYYGLRVSLNKPMRLRFKHYVDLHQGDQIIIASAGNATMREHGQDGGLLVLLRGICPGDELEIEINPEDDPQCPQCTVKACGINFIYEDDEDGDADHEKKNNYRENDLQVSEYKGSR